MRFKLISSIGDKNMMEKIYKLLKEFKKPTDLMEFDIYEKISFCIQNEMKDQKLDLNSKAFYELTAFRLSMIRIEQNELEEWEGLIYAPFFYTRDKEGKLISDPDIKNITPNMIDYWKKRTYEVDQYPILQCRYASLVWAFSLKMKGVRPDISFAHKFIDSAKAITFLDKNKPEKVYIGHILLKLEIALKTAIAINDRQRILSIKDAIIEYEEFHAKDDLPGTWGYSFDILISNKQSYEKVRLTEEQENKMIKDFERRLDIFSDNNPKTFRPDVLEDIVKKLAFYYKRKQGQKNLSRVLIRYKDSLLSAENPLATVKEPLLEKARKILFQYGLSKEAKTLEPEIRSLQEKAQKELEFKEASASIKIPNEIFVFYITEMDKRSSSDALDFIVINSIPDKEQSKNLAIEIANKHPLQNIVNHVILDLDGRGRKIAEIGPIQEDIEGRTIRQMLQAINFKLHFLAMSLDHLIETKSLNADTLSKHLFQSKIFQETHHLIIIEGIKAFFDKNYIACCSILVPQFEAGIREFVSQLGGEIYNTELSEEKGFQLKPLGALLRDKKFTQIFEQIDKNVPFYFRVIFNDSRGFNLRNNICHGDLPSHYFNEAHAFLIIHSLLILSIFFRYSKDHELNIKRSIENS